MWALAVSLGMTGVLLYVSGYFLSTTVYYGKFGVDRYDIRLFNNSFHKAAFEPLLILEKSLHDSDPAFSGQVRSGASLPPADDSRMP